VHSQLAEHVRPDNPLAQAPYLAAPYSLTNLHGIAALNHEITRQAQMIAYIDDFHLMMIVIVVALPFLLLLRRAKRPADGPAIAVD
jgi:DHA2 family multidrug resistance protein